MNFFNEMEIDYKKILNLPYQADTFQIQAFQQIINRKNLLVTAHTGSGKSTIAEFAIAWHLQQDVSRKIVYTSPIKTLSNQIYANLKKRHPDWSIGIRTGDIELNPTANIIIMTTEILRNLLIRNGSNDVKGSNDKENKMICTISNFRDFKLDIQSISCVIFDEIHYISDKDRGHVWEESLIGLPIYIQLVMLSATVSDVDKFSNWISRLKGQKLQVITTDCRVIPLTHYFYQEMYNDDDTYEVNRTNSSFYKLVQIMDNHYQVDRPGIKNVIRNNSSNHRTPVSDLNLIIESFKNNPQIGLPALFFCFSRNMCEQYANLISVGLLTDTESLAVHKEFHSLIHKINADLQGIPEVQALSTLIFKGIAYHHSGLIPVLKEVIEILFSKGLIKVLFVTETFSVGVNMPTKTVVFTDLRKPSNDGSASSSDHMRFLTTSEYLQMAGRAGRRGIDRSGTVIIMPFRMDFYNNPDLPEKIYAILKGKTMPMQSRLIIGTKYVLDQKVNEKNWKYENDGNSSDNHITSDIIRSFHDHLFFQSDLDLCNEELEQEIQILKQGLPVLDSTNIPDSVIKFVELDYDLIKPNFKIIRKLKKETEKYPDILKNYQDYRKQYQAIHEIQGKIYRNRMYIKSKIQEVTNYLKELNYFDVYGNINTAGLSASLFTECNHLLLYETYKKGILKTTEVLGITEIISMLSVFLQEKITFKPRFIIPDNDLFLMKIAQIREISNHLRVSNALIENLNFELYIQMPYLVRSWIIYGNVLKLHEIADFHHGNFCKFILRLKNLINSYVRMLEINLDESAVLFKDFEHLLVKGFVIPDSLYLSL